MSSGAPRIFPLKAVLALTGAVLLVHLALLQGTPLSLGLAPLQPAPLMTTRTVAAVPALRDQTPTPVAAPVPATPKRKPVPKEAKPEPPDVPQNPTDASPQPTGASVAQTEAASPGADTPGLAATSSAPSAEPAAALPDPPPPRVPVGAATLPGSVRLKYEVKGNRFPYSLNAKMVWQQDGENYETELTFSAGFLPVLVQNSRGKITPAGLAPIRFSDRKRTEVAAHFDREKGKVTFSANTPDAALLAGAQDRLSVTVQLGAMIAADPGRYPPGTTIAIQTIGPRDADTWVFTVEGEEVLTLPGGELATVKLMRNPRQAFDQTVELWLAPALGYLPARLRISESNGDSADSKWLATESPF